MGSHFNFEKLAIRLPVSFRLCVYFTPFTVYILQRYTQAHEEAKVIGVEEKSCTWCCADVDLREMSRRTGHTVQAKLISSLERRSIVTKLFLQVTVPRPRVYCYQIVLNLFVNDLTVFTIQTIY